MVLQVNELVRARSRILIFSVCFTISILFMTLMFLEPVRTEDTDAQPISHHVPIIGMILLQFMLLMGVLFFHFVNRTGEIDVPYNVLAGIIFVFWFLLMVGSLVYTIMSNQRSNTGNRTRIFSVVVILVLWLTNLVYFVASRISDRKEHEKMMAMNMSSNGFMSNV